MGHGAQGEVFSASTGDGEMSIALKLFRLGVDDIAIEELRQRVRREYNALKSVQHDGIVRVLDLGEHTQADDPANTGYLYLAYELINGSDLSEVLSRPKPPEPNRVVSLVTHLCAALGEAHAHELVHRDIKPANVRLKNDEWAAPTLVDFGCVRLAGALTLTKSVDAMGTFSYMAPEVRRSIKLASPASDQWSLARLACEATAVAMNAGYDDIRCLSEEAILLEHISDELPTIAATLRWGMHEDPELRYESVIDFGVAFTEAGLTDGWVDPPKSSRTLKRFEGESLLDYFARFDLPVVDKRHAEGGNLWVIASRDQFVPHRDELAAQDVAFDEAPRGSKASRGRPAWYSRSNE